LAGLAIADPNGHQVTDMDKTDQIDLFLNEILEHEDRIKFEHLQIKDLKNQMHLSLQLSIDHVNHLLKQRRLDTEGIKD
jgi:hypothetical protein